MSASYPWRERLVEYCAQTPRASAPIVEAAADPAIRRAAVLIALSDEADPELILVRRAAALRSHPGQVALPGGSIEDGETAIDAALREADEEVDLTPDCVTPLGCLPDHRTVGSDFSVTPVIGVFRGVGALFAKDIGEVASVHRVQISRLAAPTTRVTATLMHGYKGPAFDIDGLFVWGFTAHLVDTLLTIGGWSQEWDREKLVDVPIEFFRPEAT